MVSDKDVEKDLVNNEDWILSRLERTILRIRVGDTWDKIMSIELGSSRHVSEFLGMISRNLAVGTIEKLSVLLPCNIGKLEKYVLHVEAGKPESFQVLLDTLQNAIVRLGATRPVRYLLTGTATVRVEEV